MQCADFQIACDTQLVCRLAVKTISDFVEEIVNGCDVRTAKGYVLCFQLLT